MSVEQNKASVRRFSEEVLGKGNLSIIPELIAPNYVFHTTPEYKGPEGLRQYVTMLRTAFPDLHISLDHLFAEGDLVAAFYRFGGTFKGEMMGISPTGKKFEISVSVMSRLAGGKQVDAFPHMDMLNLFQQLGVSPPSSAGSGEK
jgi:predicted ester cyclase